MTHNERFRQLEEKIQSLEGQLRALEEPLRPPPHSREEFAQVVEAHIETHLAHNPHSTPEGRTETISVLKEHYLQRKTQRKTPEEVAEKFIKTNRVSNWVITVEQLADLIRRDREGSEA